MMHQLKTIVALSTAWALVAAGLTGCDSSVAPDAPEATRYSETGTEPPASVDGRLGFADAEHLAAYLEPLIDADPAELAAVEQRVAGFQSLRDYVDGGEWSDDADPVDPDNEEPTGNEAKALEADGVTREDFPIGDAFLSVLNAAGQVQVGDSVFKLTRDNTYRVQVEDVGLLEKAVPTLSSPAPAESDARIRVDPVETTERSQDGEEARFILNTSTCFVTAGSYRMRGASYITNVIWYAEAGVNTAWQRRKRIWFVTYWANTSHSGTLGHDWTAYLRQAHHFLPLAVVYDGSDGESVRDKGQIHETLAWGVMHRIRGWIEADHTVANSIINATCHTSARN